MPIAPSSTRRAMARPAWTRSLAAWYQRARRPMPWRGIRDPYRIWVSEVMLQQTRVDAVRPYYKDFIRRFPSVARLARARVDDVLAAWSGLGYYRRARHLHAAARIVVREHAGRVPDDPLAFGRLPGVGRYTTGAVLSISFDRPYPVVDGNVARVLSRLHALDATLKSGAGARALWSIAASLMPRRDPGDWNQALMELGASICTPRAPACTRCPVAGACRALALGRVDAFPPRASRPVVEQVRRAVALLARGGSILMVRREGSQLEGLWEPPGVDLAARPAAGPRLKRELARLGLVARLRREDVEIRHAVTRRSYLVEIWRGTPRGRLMDPSGRWVRPGSPGVPLTGLARKILGAIPTPE